MNREIVLVPLGSVPPDLFSWLIDRLMEGMGQEIAIGQEVVKGEEIPLPDTGYHPDRHQYEGDALIAVLRNLPYPGAGRVVGLIEADCYSPGLNFILGQAALGGREAFVALPRLRQSFYGLPEDPELFRERVLKEVLHELGHTWGLSHCRDHSCVMHFSNELSDTDLKRADFCPQCQDLLR